MHKRALGIRSFTNTRLGRIGFLSCALIVSGLTVKVALFAHPAGGGEDTPRAVDCGGQDCAAAVRGLGVFLDHQPDGLGGNGRACADCHMPTGQFQLSPADAEARYQILQFRRRFDPKADDPLFRPIDADDFRVNGAQASDYTTLRQHALIRIVFPLPAAMRLIDPATNQPSSETSVDVWRSVPSIDNVALTGPDGQNPWARGPNPAGGYQLDARFGTLQEQALAAFTVHAQIQRAPAQQVLDDLAAFQLNVFSSLGVRALADAVRTGRVPLPDPDPPLTDLEKQGKVVFTRACAQCHGGPGLSTALLPVLFRYADVSTTCPPPVDTVTPPRFVFPACPDALAKKVRTYEFTLPNGAKVRRASSDPGRALLTAFVGGPPPSDDWDKLDVPGLHGISHTAPYFHNNTAATLDDVVDHYIEFFKEVQATAPPGGAPPVASTDGIHFDRAPTPAEKPALVAYLRKL